MCNCNEEINKKCPNRVCAYCDWHLELQAKEQECEELKQWKEDAKNLFKTQIDNADKIVNRYKQVLDEIEYQTKELFLGVENKDRPYCEKILNIINKAKDGE